MGRRIEGWAVGPHGARGCAVLLACLGVALIFGVVAPSAAGPTPSFGGPKHYATGRSPGSVALGDLNGDGKPEIVTANYDAGTVSVLLNRGDASFRPRRDYAVGSFPTSVAIDDLNGDGRPDLVTANNGSDSNPGKTVTVLLNRGDGSFAVKHDYETGSVPGSVAIGDLNGDGKPDLVTANNGGTVSVLLNRGDGSFGAKLDYATGSRPTSVALGDLNSDGKLDLVTANSNSDSVSVLFNRGDGSFEARRNYPLGFGSNPESVAIGDLNGDGKLDLATASLNSDSVSVLLNSGDGTFKASRDYHDNFGPQSIAIGDLNGDGNPDLATTNQEEDFVFVLANKGDGRFQAAVAYWTRNVGTDYGVAIGDLNGDGKSDVVTTNYDVSSVSVLTNATGLCKVPNVKGKTLPAAKRAIARANCRVGTIRRDYSKNVKRDRVISVKPKLGTVLRKGGKVELVVSRGRKR